MLRRTILTAALAACTVVPVLAQDRATFVLNNGQSHNGMLVYGRGDNNIVDDQFHLATGSGELIFPIGDVAVIDIAGGTPTTTEVNAVPGDAGGVMVMRSGTVVRGHLHNIMRGGLVQWVNEGGQRQNYPIDEVRRLYLNSENARMTYLRSTTPAAVVGTAGTVSAATVRVDGNQQWVDSGIDVRQGDRIQFNASGQIEFAPGLRASAGGENGRSGGYPVPMMGVGGLIAKVGDSAAFAVGSGTRIFTMPGDGRLYLGVNDDNVTDNSGAFTVSVRRR